MWVEAVDLYQELQNVENELKSEGQEVEEESNIDLWDKFERFRSDDRNRTWIKPKGHRDPGINFDYEYDKVGWVGYRLQAIKGDMIDGEYGSDMESAYFENAHHHLKGMTKQEAAEKFISTIERYLVDPKLIKK